MARIKLIKGFKMFRLTDDEIIVVHTASQRASYVHWNKELMRPLAETKKHGWRLRDLSNGDILHEIV